MIVEKFNFNFYLEMSGWYMKRNLKPIPMDNIPNIGFIIKDICAGFLYKADGKMGLIENYISNPMALSSDRNEGLNRITEELIKEAKLHDIKYIIGTTKEDSIVKRSESFGWKDIGKYNVIFMEL